MQTTSFYTIDISMDSSQNKHRKKSVEEEHLEERRRMERRVSSEEAENMGDSLPTGFRGEGFNNGRPDPDERKKK